MKQYVYVAVAGILLSLFSCKDHCIKGDGNVMNNASRYFNYFDIIQSNINADVYITYVNDTLPDEVFIRCDGNLDPYIHTSVDKSNNTLYIELDNEHCIRPSRPIEVYVYAHRITGIISNSSGKMICDSIVSSNLSIQVLGNGGIYMTGISIDLITGNLVGNGTIEIEGKGINGTYVNWAGGRFTAAQMMLSGNCSATCKGTGGMSVYCKNILTADPGPNGAVITFYGNPHMVIAPQERVVPGN